MPRGAQLYLEDILIAIDTIREYTKGICENDFMQDRKTQDAVVRNLEIIGEAAGHLPDELKANAPEIEWRKMVGLRNLLAHEYFVVSPIMLWDILQSKLEPLKRACERLS